MNAFHCPRNPRAMRPSMREPNQLRCTKPTNPSQAKPNPYTLKHTSSKSWTFGPLGTLDPPVPPPPSAPSSFRLHLAPPPPPPPLSLFLGGPSLSRNWLQSSSTDHSSCKVSLFRALWRSRSLFCQVMQCQVGEGRGGEGREGMKIEFGSRQAQSP
ncbi:hypothetical protein Mp_4g01340 [Marchantia polymorpha subsp. ruderalis]|uniref:Uncharacterized protein n=2 Tax=Marchantia polymorpha TaxID=3197 RepID=A0AAF6B554_MARPO|nr:hypothetical protein MARPO_0066s0009 [Marchantia polymorpha]BBN07138.1 hypothetical protein Mp_4g01340 [Marchantia polymorpha subsp. ruderalis]|eukprot:PTQ36046.1 hypothetical protein MARPO_0066s0009 [Marchantia polymorpha]